MGFREEDTICVLLTKGWRREGMRGELKIDCVGGRQELCGA